MDYGLCHRKSLGESVYHILGGFRGILMETFWGEVIAGDINAWDISGIRQGDNKKKPGGKERIMGSHRANAKGYNGIEGPIYKIV